LKPGTPNQPFVVLMAGAVVVAALHFGRPLLAPLAMALLLVFMLAPLVDRLQRRGLPGAAPVILVMLASIGVVGVVGVLVFTQSQALVEQLPFYESNIRDRLTVLRDARAGTLSPAAQHTLTELASALEGPPEPEDGATPVTVVETPTSLGESLAPVLAPLTTLGLTLMLAFFILLQRRALRDRVVHMFGRRNLAVTTRALDEAAQRISRYLLVQGLLNLGFGAVIALGLYAIGLDFAPLWGLIAALMRFIPYIGPWIAATLPATLSLATSTGWTQPLMVLGLFAATELTLNLVLEPLLYGRSAGIQPVALVVTVTFWTLIWGPIGLFVATPLTVCLLVLCRHVPQLAFLAFLLGDEPAAADDAKYFQRLLAHDEDEALQIALEHARTCAPEEACDDLLLPALSALKAERAHDGLAEADMSFGVRATRHIAEALDGAPPPAAPAERPSVLGCPASDEVDVLALGMLRRLLLRSGQCELEVLGSNLLSSEMLAHAERARPALVCIGALAPGGLAGARLLCRRLRAMSPQMRIVVGRWQSATPEDDARMLVEAGADRVGTTLLETQQHLLSLSLLAQPT
jgi:predicted PurR-regulated permease PerM